MAAQMSAHQIYRNCKPFPFDVNNASPHSPRPTNFDNCFICGETNAPEVIQQKFKDEARTRIQYMDRSEINGAVEKLCELMKCGDEECRHKFHLSCMTNYQPIYQFRPLYLSLEKTFGSVKCPDHFCHTCFSESNMQSAGRDNLVLVADEVRAYHINCYPAGASDAGSNMIRLPEKRNFKGKNMGICCGCGSKNNRREKLIKCSKCISSFHPRCNPTKISNVDSTTHCPDCIFDIKFRKTDLVLVRYKNGPFLAAVMIDWRVNNEGKQETLIQFKSALREPRWYPLNAVFRPYPSLSGTFYHTMKISDSLKSLKNLGQDIYKEEWSALSEHLKAQFTMKPNIARRPLPDFKRNYIIHESLYKEGANQWITPIPLECHPDVEPRFIEGKGYGVFAKKKLDSGSIVGEYIGEMVTKRESERREKLGAHVHDNEQNFYSYQTEIAGKRVSKLCVIDGAKHQNQMSLINSSCLPNCEIEKKLFDLGNGKKFQRLFVKVTQSIGKDEELYLCYNWTGFKCWCGLTENCRKKMEGPDWSIPAESQASNADENEDPIGTNFTSTKSTKLKEQNKSVHSKGSSKRQKLPQSVKDHKFAASASTKKSKLIRRNEKTPSKHSPRTTDYNTCFICQQRDAPEDTQSMFERQVKECLKSSGNANQLANDEWMNELVNCGEDDCLHMFHLSCITFYRPMPKFQVQYLCMNKNQGTIKCPDHVCEICVTESRIQSARRDELVKARDEIRAFHRGCIPAGAVEVEDNMILLPKKMEFHGRHLNICSLCAGADKRQLKKPLEKCSQCVNTYHDACHKLYIKDKGQVKKCVDCFYDTCIRRSDRVLVRDGNSPFFAATMEDFRTRGNSIETLIRFRNENRHSKWVPLNAVFRVYPALSYSFYSSMRQKDTLQGLKRDMIVYKIEWEALSEHLKEQLYSKPSIVPRPIPRFDQRYEFHSSFTKYLPKNFVMPTPEATHKDVEVRSAGGLGFGLFAKRILTKGTFIGEYAGEWISKGELHRRRRITIHSHDAEGMFYEYQAYVEKKGKKTTCAIDAACVRNEMSMINTSCIPNCVVVEHPIELDDTVTLIAYRIMIVRDVKMDEELTLSYHWRNFDCTCCHTNKCKKAQMSYDWSIPQGEEENFSLTKIPGSTRKRRANQPKVNAKKQKKLNLEPLLQVG